MTTMDEHDKRAREVADDVHLLPGPRRELSKRISALLRSTAAAAERRIAARLRARADEEVKKAERASGTQYFSDAISHTHAAAVLRAEADALEVGT